MVFALSSKRSSAKARSSAWTVFTVSPTIQRLTVDEAAGGSICREAVMPFDWQKRAAFHNLVAKLR